MIGRLNGFNDLNRSYKKRLDFFGVSHPVGNKMLNGYRNATQFMDNLRAPFQIPIISAGGILRSAINCLQNILLLGITFLTFDFSKAANHGIEVINSITDMLYTSVRAIFDTFVSALELLTRSVATLVEGIGEVVAPYSDCF